MVEGLQGTIQKWLWNIGNEDLGTFTEVSTEVETEMRTNATGSLKFEKNPVRSVLYSITKKQGNFTVNIHERKCNSKRFQQDEIPCCHALIEIVKRRLSCYNYCFKNYKTTTMRGKYEATLNPLPNECEWKLVEHLEIK
ncbi:uncharacterized protein LOC133806158 [Humulus lupulus]|uniref:uncharacterized protein LOC133806158 n=1 Tax=Humulus lupulus TaxID=3486 RepID=UPI002B404E50|nr:uncharacterized protein LOC133806158 [Humulus lupulus]